MSKHVSYRGKTIDMDSLRRENEEVRAIGNNPVNARGDKVYRGVVTRSADDIARDNHKTKTAIVTSGLKGKQPVAPSPVLEAPKKDKIKSKKSDTPSKTKEVELDSGDIIIEDDVSDDGTLKNKKEDK